MMRNTFVVATVKLSLYLISIYFCNLLFISLLKKLNKSEK